MWYYLYTYTLICKSESSTVFNMEEKLWKKTIFSAGVCRLVERSTDVLLLTCTLSVRSKVSSGSVGWWPVYSIMSIGGTIEVYANKLTQRNGDYNKRPLFLDHTNLDKTCWRHVIGHVIQIRHFSLYTLLAGSNNEHGSYEIAISKFQRSKASLHRSIGNKFVFKTL